MTTDFSVVLPVRDTDEEYWMLSDSLASAIALNPNEVIVCLDEPSSRLMSRVKRVAEIMNFEALRFLIVSRSVDWKFQLAKIVWTAYAEAKHDTILSFDVDTILYPKAIKKGLRIIGRDNVALVSFCKVLQISSLPDMVRMFFYWTSRLYLSKPFAGLYLVDRNAYFQTLTEEQMRNLANGVDTILSQNLWKQRKFKVVCLPDFGCLCLTPQNNDYMWRQFQDGLWSSANAHKQNNWKDWKNPLLQTLLRSHPYFLCGFSFGMANPSSTIVKRAKGMDICEWGYRGQEFLRGLKS